MKSIIRRVWSMEMVAYAVGFAISFGFAAFLVWGAKLSAADPVITLKSYAGAIGGQFVWEIWRLSKARSDAS